MAFGGVLSQKDDDGSFHPVAYFSDTITKEAFALILAVLHWYVYLAGNSFTLKSDHNPLVYLGNQNDPHGKFGRWIMELEEFDYEICYIPGSKNVKADALSRNCAANEDQPTSRFDEHMHMLLKIYHFWINLEKNS